MNRFTRRWFWVLSPAVLLLVLNAQTISETKLVGKWKLNTAKSQFQSIPRPNAATLVISQATASHLKWQATTTFSGGGRSVMGFDGAVDGKPYVYKGAQRGTQLSFVDNNGILEATATYPGGETMHQTSTVSPDGNTMTAQCSLSSASAAAAWTEVWERVPDKKRR